MFLPDSATCSLVFIRMCDLPVASEIDIAVNRKPTLTICRDVILNPLTWLPALAYLTTFGFELAIDSTLANIFFALYASKTFGQTKAGYVRLLLSVANAFFSLKHIHRLHPRMVC